MCPYNFVYKKIELFYIINIINNNATITITIKNV